MPKRKNQENKQISIKDIINIAREVHNELLTVVQDLY